MRKQDLQHFKAEAALFAFALTIIAAVGLYASVYIHTTSIGFTDILSSPISSSNVKQKHNSYPDRSGGRLEAGETEQSKSSIEQASSDTPESVNGYMNKARETGDRNFYLLAESSLNAMLKKDPSNYEALRIKGWIQAEDNRFSQALDSAKYASELHPNDGWNYCVMVDALIGLGRYSEAIEAAQKMVNLMPTGDAYIRIATLRWLFGNPKGAEDALRTALKSGKLESYEIADCVNLLGDLYLIQGKLDAAREQYQLVLKTHPDSTQALSGMGKVHVAQLDYEPAIKYYSLATAKNPSLTTVIELGKVYELAGEGRRAKECFALAKRVAQHTRLSPEHALPISYLHSDSGREPQKALQLSKRFSKNNNSIYAYDALAWSYYRNNQFSEARSAIKKALRLGTKDATIFFHAGMIYWAVKDAEQAEKYLKKALRANPYFDAQGAKTASATLEKIQNRRILMGKVYRVFLIFISTGFAFALNIAFKHRKSKTETMASESMIHAA